MEKRRQSCLIPFCQNSGDIQVFLQRRSKTAKRLPDYFGFWGGGIEESETPEEALRREIEEELGIQISDYSLFNHYEFYGSTKDVYTIEVNKDFGSNIKIGEGQYGQFFTEDEIKKELKIINEDRVILENFFGKMKRGNVVDSN